MLVFQTLPSATIKAKSTTSTTMYMINGITQGATTPANAATQINKILGIAGKAIAADEYMTRTRTEEVIDDE